MPVSNVIQCQQQASIPWDVGDKRPLSLGNQGHQIIPTPRRQRRGTSLAAVHIPQALASLHPRLGGG